MFCEGQVIFRTWSGARRSTRRPPMLIHRLTRLISRTAGRRVGDSCSLRLPRCRTRHMFGQWRHIVGLERFSPRGSTSCFIKDGHTGRSSLVALDFPRSIKRQNKLLVADHARFTHLHVLQPVLTFRFPFPSFCAIGSDGCSYIAPKHSRTHEARGWPSEDAKLAQD